MKGVLRESIFMLNNSPTHSECALDSCLEASVAQLQPGIISKCLTI